MAKEMSSFESKMNFIKAKYEKDLQALEAKQKDHEKSEKEKIQKEVDAKKEEITNLQKLHDQEVQNVFEDEKTLTFIKKMRDFKKAWQTNKSIDKRKQTAGQMAEATKNWISSYE